MNLLVEPCGNHALDCLKLSFLAVANTIFFLSSSICVFSFLWQRLWPMEHMCKKNVFLHLGCFLRSIFACCFRKHALTQGPGLDKHCSSTTNTSFGNLHLVSAFVISGVSTPRWLEARCSRWQASEAVANCSWPEAQRNYR